jgi:hypothetical protein
VEAGGREEQAKKRDRVAVRHERLDESVIVGAMEGSLEPEEVTASLDNPSPTPLS